MHLLRVIDITIILLIGVQPYVINGEYDYYLSYSPRYTEGDYKFPYTNEKMFKWYYLSDTEAAWPTGYHKFFDIPWPDAMGVRREEELLSGMPKLYEYDCSAKSCDIEYVEIELLFYGVPPDIYCWTPGLGTPTPDWSRVSIEYQICQEVCYSYPLHVYVDNPNNEYTHAGYTT